MNLLTNPFLNALVNACTYYTLVLILGWIILFIHDLLTPGYRTWAEIARGNAAVGTAAAGQIAAIAIIAHFAIKNNWTLTWALVWTGLGGVLLIIGYLLFELLTPRLNVGKELAADNRAVGLVSAGISIGTALIIGACMG